MFDINKLEKEDLIEYIKKLDDVMDTKDRYIDALEERIYEQNRLNNIDIAIEDLRNLLRAAIARKDRFEKSYVVNVNVIDLNKEE